MSFQRKLFNRGLQKIYGLSVPTSIIKSFQTITTDANFSGFTNTESITTVNASNCLLQIGCHLGTGGSSEGRSNLLNVQISDTQLTFTKDNSTAGNYRYEVDIIEFEGANVVSNQFVSGASNSPSGFKDFTVTPVSSSNLVYASHLGHTTSNTNNRVYQGTYANMTAASNLRLSNGFVSSFYSAHNIRGQVIEIAL